MLHTVPQNTWKSSDFCVKCTEMGVILVVFLHVGLFTYRL